MQERPASPDLFSSSDSSQHTPLDTEELTNIFGDDEWIRDNNEEYYGTSMSDLYRKNSPWNYYTPQLCPSRHHTVLFEMPATLNQPPKPHYSSNTSSHWDSNHVRMPFSPKNIFPVKENKKTVLKPRWDIIKRSLSQPIMSSVQLEAAIFSYNLRHRKFEALHHFFEEVLDEEESKHFFHRLLPQIIQLALQLPELIPTPVPLLKQGKPHTVSLSQVQIASLLANAFLCTFPWKKECSTYPGINFNRLYECQVTSEPSVLEKLKCFIHYFRCVCSETRKGVVTFERKHLPRTQLPRWDKNENNISDIKLHVTHKGTIENDGKGCLQVDFANCMVGGGVLGYGCVQEEIRFAICPELLVSRLFTEQLSHNEALLIIGPECYSVYTGYASTFEWAGTHHDDTPYDAYGRRRTTILAIDALLYYNTAVQFRPSKIIRELNKAYVGFHELSCTSTSNSALLSPVATGNWGCGAFRGNHHLKALIQIMACAAARRNIVYYTFGAKDLQTDVFNIYNFLASHSITVAQLWRYLCQFTETGVSSRHLLPFIKQAHLDSVNNTLSNNRTKITNYFPKKTPKAAAAEDDTKPTNSNSFNATRPLDSSSVQQSSNNKQEICNTNKKIENTQTASTSKWLPPQSITTADEDNIIESSQNDDRPAADLLKFTHKMNSRNESKLSNSCKALSVLISSDEDSDNDEKKCEGFLTTLDKLNTSIDLPARNTNMDVEISSSDESSLMEVCVTNGRDNEAKSVKGNTAQYEYNTLNVVVTKKKTPMKISDYFMHLK